MDLINFENLLQALDNLDTQDESKKCVIKVKIKVQKSKKSVYIWYFYQILKFYWLNHRNTENSENSNEKIRNFQFWSNLRKSYFNFLVTFFFLYSKVINMQCSVGNWEAIKKHFSLKIRPALKLQIFSLLFGEFSVILRFIIYKILEFDRNNAYSHFCFSKILILRENKYRAFFMAIGIPKEN